MDLNASGDFYRRFFKRAFKTLNYSQLPSTYVAKENFDGNNVVTVDISNERFRFPLQPSQVNLTNPPHAKWALKEDRISIGLHLNNVTVLSYQDVPIDIRLNYLDTSRSQMRMIPVYLNSVFYEIRNHLEAESLHMSSFDTLLHDFDYSSIVHEEVKLFPYSKQELIERITKSRHVIETQSTPHYTFCIENPNVKIPFWYALASIWTLPTNSAVFDEIFTEKNSTAYDDMIERIRYSALWDAFGEPPLSGINTSIDLLNLFLPSFEEIVSYMVEFAIVSGLIIDAGWCLIVPVEKFMANFSSFSYSISDLPRLTFGHALDSSIHDQYALALRENPDRSPQVEKAMENVEKFLKWVRIFDFELVKAYRLIDKANVDLINEKLTTLENQYLEIPEPRLIEYSNNYSW